VLVVHVAPTLEALAAAWTELVIAREAAAPAGSFSSTAVVVPDPGVAHVLDFALARRRGVAANIRMETSLGRALGTERGALLGPLVGLLERLAAAESAPASPLEPLRRWLTLGDEPLALLGPRALDEAKARRRAALALRLARRFETYAEAPDADPVASWTAGRAAPSAAGQAETEGWQRALWERLPRPGGDLTVEGGEPLHVVAPAALSPSQVRDLARSAAAREVHAWFVLPAPGRIAGERGGHPLARGASAAVHDGLTRLQEAAPGALDLVPGPTRAATTLLARLQAVLRGGAPGPGQPDPSLEALACADARRAAEVVAQEIGLALRRAEAQGRPLRLQEIAVVLAGDDPDGDRARLAMAFDAAHRLPLVFSDASPTRELRPVEAARRLLALPGSALVRSEVTELLIHPCVLQRLAVEETMPELQASFEAWIEAAGVIRGLDASDQAGTYLAAEPAPLHTWDQGLLRLALAAYMDPASLDDPAPGVVLAPAPLGPGARVERLVALARSLLADARALRDLRLPLPAWADLLARWVAGLVSGTDEAERGALERALGALRGLAHVAEDDDAPEPASIPYGVARALADEALAKLRPRRDHDLTGGVVVGGLQALRGAPFRVVFLLGLAEGAFPAAEPHDALDLRGPVAWDPGRRARDQAALVERVLATTERLAVVWVARDPLTNEEVPWSPAVGALVRAAVDAGLVASPDAIVRRPPARREEEAGEAPATAGGRREARARALRLDLDRHLAGHGLEGATLDDARLPVLDAALEATGAPRDASPTTADPPVQAGHVTLAALHDLLESPLQAWAKAGLRLWRDEEAGGDLEPFAPARMDEVVWLREAFVTAVTGSRAGDPRFERALGAAWDRLADRARRAGRGPTGPFLAAARTRALRALGAWRDALDASPGLAHLRGVRGVRFGTTGGPPPGALPEEPRPPLVLELPGRVQVALVGRTGPILADGTPLLLVDGRQATDSQLARAALELAALEAAGLLTPGDEPHRLRVVPSKGPGRTVRLRPFGRDAALDWLATLAADLRQPHPYALPLGPAARWLRRAADVDGGSLVDALRLGRESRHTPWDDDHGPLPRPRRAAPPPDAEALARRRLGPWLGRELEGRAGKGLPRRPEAGETPSVDEDGGRPRGDAGAPEARPDVGREDRT
jgi:exodeoxyribonuclease V gamma subunit